LHSDEYYRWEALIGYSILVGLVLGIFIHVYSQPVVYIREAEAKEDEVEVILEVKIDWTKERIEQEIRTAANKYGVSYEKMYNTIKCESGFDIDIQSQNQLSYGREQSYGLSQWHIPAKNKTADGTVITKEMALDPIVALDAMAYHFSVGNARAWTCFRKLYM
jgi:hypothetical protein